MSAAPSATRRAGLIAAGRGERLRSGAGPLKPLVPISGRPLIERVLMSIAETAPGEVTIIINDNSTAVRDAVERVVWPFDRRWIVETTPTSMHSFLRVVETLAGDGHPGPFLVSTVDTVTRAGTYRAFAAAAAAMAADVVLAVNHQAPDDKPLLVRIGADGLVTAIGAEAARKPSGVLLATAGMYMVRSTVLSEADAARREGLPALRAFLARLLDRHFTIAAIPVADSRDVDRPEDVGAAEVLLREARA